MVLRIPIEAISIKNEDKYAFFFCSHVLCPIAGRNVQEKVSVGIELILLKKQRFHSNALSVLNFRFTYWSPLMRPKKICIRTIQDILKKKIRCLLFGQPSTVKKVMGVMLEAEDSNKGNFDDEEQKNLFARCFMEHVTLTLFLFSNLI